MLWRFQIISREGRLYHQCRILRKNFTSKQNTVNEKHFNSQRMYGRGAQQRLYTEKKKDSLYSNFIKALLNNKV